MTTTLKLTFLRETTGARHYQLKPGCAQWIPRSVCTKTLKSGDLHEVTIEDWWLEKNPFEKKASEQADLFTKPKAAT